MGAESFEGDDLGEFVVVDEVDFAHAAFAEETEDAVAGGDDGIDGEMVRLPDGAGARDGGVEEVVAGGLVEGQEAAGFGENGGGSGGGVKEGEGLGGVESGVEKFGRGAVGFGREAETGHLSSP